MIRIQAIRKKQIKSFLYFNFHFFSLTVLLNSSTEAERVASFPVLFFLNERSHVHSSADLHLNFVLCEFNIFLEKKRCKGRSIG